MEAHHVGTAEDACQEDVVQPMDGVEPGSEANVVPPSTELNVVPSGTEQPLSSSVEPIADAAGQLQ